MCSIYDINSYNTKYVASKLFQDKKNLLEVLLEYYITHKKALFLFSPFFNRRSDIFCKIIFFNHFVCLKIQ